ncbi:MAG: ArnT family glycosyltransferase [Brevinematia bacterium]
MKKNKKWVLNVFVPFCLIAIMYVIYILSYRAISWKITEIKVIKENLEETPLKDFTEFQSNRREYFTFRFNIKGERFLKWIKIVPDDEVLEIKADGNPLPLSIIKPHQLKDYVNGFFYPLGDYLEEGDNQIEIKIINHGGRGGLKIFNTSKNIFPFLVFLTLKILFFVLCVFVISRFRLPVLLKGLISIFVVVGIISASLTLFDQKTHDVYEHLKYIEFVADNLKIPHPEGGWAFYHPPLYYIISALVWKALPAGDFLSKNYNIEMLQYFSLFIWLFYIIFAILSHRELIYSLLIPERSQFLKKGFIKSALKKLNLNFKELLFLMSGTLFIFWPANILHSIRIGNDTLLYLFYSGSFFYILRYYKSKSLRDFLLSLFFAVIGMLTKTNAVILFALMGFSVIFLWKNKNLNFKKASQKFLILVFAFLLCFPLSYRTFTYRLFEKKSSSIKKLIVANSDSLNAELKVQNELFNYVWFDLKMFITEPFVNPADDKTGRQFFWNYLAKTSLFGEFGFPSVYKRNLAVLISILFLIMVTTTIVGTYYLSKREREILRMVTLNLILSLIFLIAFRMIIPTSCSNDFRYILPSLISFCGLFSISLYKLLAKGRKNLFLTGFFSAILFVICSILIYV